MFLLRNTFAFLIAIQCFFWAYIIWLDLLGIRIVFGITFGIQILVWLYSVYEYKNIIRHYQYQTAWMLISQLIAFIVLDEPFSTSIDFIYFNTTDNTYDDGLVEATGGSLSTTALIFAILQITTTQFLFSSFRTIDNTKKVQYEPGFKWYEYSISSSLQKVVLYRIYGQVAQAIICVAGLNAAFMFIAYFIEKKIIDYFKRKRNIQNKNSLQKNENEIDENKFEVDRKNTEEKENIENDEEGEDTQELEENDLNLNLIKADQIGIQTTYGDFFKIEYGALNTVETVKEKIQNEMGISVKLQKLVFDNKNLENEKTLLYYNIKKNSTIELIEEDIIGNLLLKYPRWVISISFVFYSSFIYGPLFVYNDDRPAWVQTFLVGMILNDLSFPAIMMYKLSTLDYVSTDLLFSSASLNSKNTMDYIIILGIKRASVGLIYAAIPLSFIFSFIIYKISPNYSKNGIYVLNSPKQKRYQKFSWHKLRYGTYRFQ